MPFVIGTSAVVFVSEGSGPGILCLWRFRAYSFSCCGSPPDCPHSGVTLCSPCRSPCQTVSQPLEHSSSTGPGSLDSNDLAPSLAGATDTHFPCAFLSTGAIHLEMTHGLPLQPEPGSTEPAHPQEHRGQMLSQVHEGFPQTWWPRCLFIQITTV